MSYKLREQGVCPLGNNRSGQNVHAKTDSIGEVWNESCAPWNWWNWWETDVYRPVIRCLGQSPSRVDGFWGGGGNSEMEDLRYDLHPVDLHWTFHQSEVGSFNVSKKIWDLCGLKDIKGNVGERLELRHPLYHSVQSDWSAIHSRSVHSKVGWL